MQVVYSPGDKPAKGTYVERCRFAIEGRINGQWSRAHVGDVNDTTLFDSEDEAAEAINDLVDQTHTTVTGWTSDTLRVVEVVS